MLQIDDEGERPHNHFYIYAKKDEEMVCGYLCAGRDVGKES